MIEFGLFGPMRVSRDGEDLLLPPGKERALLAALLLQRGDAVSSERLVEAVWGDPAPATARNALQGRVSALRKLLGPDRIATLAPGYVLHASADEVDLARFEQLVHAARAAGPPAKRAELAREALALRRGEPLAEFRYAAFAQPAIARFQELRLVALEERIEAELELGHTELVSELEALIAAEPLRERFYALLMLALYRAGRQADALEVYRKARTLLVEELGLEPGPKLQEMNRAILAHDPSLAPDRREFRLPSRSLPAPPTPLVGRRLDVETIERLLASGARLVTITGEGGAGKTRLALEVARRSADRGERVAFVLLAPVGAPDLLASTIARSLGIDETPGEPVAETIERCIGDTRLLLVADNLEHLLEGTPVLAGLLESCPQLTLLATSRSPLRLKGEHAHPLDPLALDDAVALFEARALAANPRFAFDRELVAVVCERLDCMPLALELAAARASLLSLSDLLARLDRRFDVLTGGARDSPDRQRTLRNTIDWSYNLLDDKAARFFARSAVFSGGCTLDAAEAVCGSALETLDVLVDASLIRRRETASGVRFSMLQTIREYALERLAESSAAVRTARSHAAYFVEFAERGAAELEGPRQRAAVADLDAELDNLRAALAWSHEHEPEWALRLAAALGRFWAMRGLFKEARRWLDAVLAPEDGASSAAAKAFLAAGNFAGYYEGDHARAREMLTRGLDIARKTGQNEYVGRILTALGRTARGQGDSDAARRYYEEALDIQRSVGDVEHAAVTLTNLGITLLETGDVSHAAALLAEGVQALRDTADDAMLAVALQSLAYAQKQRGERDEAEASAREGLALALAVDDQPAMAWGLVVLASTEADLVPARAAELLAAAEAAYTRLGLAWDPLDLRVREEVAATVRARLDDALLRAAHAAGSQTELDAAVRAALG